MQASASPKANDSSAAPPQRLYGGSGALVAVEPEWRAAPSGAPLSPRLEALRPSIYSWIEDYYDREHLTRAGDWMLALEPAAPDHLVVAALLHDLERKVPGGPDLDMANTPWDDRGYNDAHTGRSAVVVPAWLTAYGVDAEIAAGVARPIREHEFGGSPEGDLMQAVDSISFLETNAGLVAGWATRGRCSPEKAMEKLRWMGERVRHPEGSRIARLYMERAVDEFEALRRES
ncbi:MAG TPA: hypothetical protein VGO24_03785 [Solirubrobacterales bacterium]|nr:hypothetical protein [Solirubrobacterales bacterium]